MGEDDATERIDPLTAEAGAVRAVAPSAPGGIGSAPPSASPVSGTVGGATHVEYKDDSGVVRVESWLVKGMSHGVALDPKAGCGTAGAYLLDEGVCSTEKAAAFFGLVAADGSPTPPGGTPPSSSVGTSGSAPGDCRP